MYIKCLLNQYTYKLFRGWLYFAVFLQSDWLNLFYSLYVFDFPFALDSHVSATLWNFSVQQSSLSPAAA